MYKLQEIEYLLTFCQRLSNCFRLHLNLKSGDDKIRRIKKLIRGEISRFR